MCVCLYKHEMLSMIKGLRVQDGSGMRHRSFWYKLANILFGAFRRHYGRRKRAQTMYLPNY